MSFGIPFELLTFNILADAWTGYTKVNNAPEIRDQATRAKTIKEGLALAEQAAKLEAEAKVLTNATSRCQKVVTAIKSYSADIVLLQEVQSSAVEIMRKELESIYWFSKLAENHYSSAPEPIGTLTLVHREFYQSNKIQATPVWMNSGHLDEMDGSTGQLVTIDNNHGNIIVLVNLHLGYGEEVRNAQLQVLRGAINNAGLRKLPLIIAGDLNAVCEEVEESFHTTGFRMLKNALSHPPNTFFSGTDPNHTRQCDHVYMSYEKMPKLKVRVPSGVESVTDALTRYGSDHIPVSVILCD